MPKRYWLFKSEPSAFSIDDLAASPDRITHWEGVRNYQARNLLRDDIRKGDEVLFHHSNAKPSGVIGRCRVVRSGYPDHTARDPRSKYYDPKATEDEPRWYMVDVQFVESFAEVIPLSVLKQTRGLEKMMVVQRGSRLSVQPVTPEEWKIVLRLARRMKG